MIEHPYPLRSDCSNCPEPAGGRGVLRSEGGPAAAVYCAGCHTLNFTTSIAAAGIGRPERPQTWCPSCKARMQLTPDGNCPRCGLTDAAMAAIEELGRLYDETVADLTIQRDKAIELLIAVSARATG